MTDKIDDLNNGTPDIPDTRDTIDRAEIHQVLGAYYSAFNSMDKEGVLEAFTEDADFIDLSMGRSMKGRSELAGFIDDTWSLSPYFRLEPEEVLIDGSNVAVRLFMSGAAKIDQSGVPKEGYLWRIPSTSFLRFRDGKIDWKADCWNALAIPKQIGWLKVLPSMIRSGLA